MRDLREVSKALEDSRKLLKKFPKKFNIEGSAYMSFQEMELSIRALSVQNEICTLRWVLKHKGSKMNCYGKETKKFLEKRKPATKKLGGKKIWK